MTKFRYFLPIILCFFSPLYAADLHVGPGKSYVAIQPAIDAASDNDTIIVHPGTYTENINFRGKAITLRSLDPLDPCTVAQTIIDGSNPADPNNASTVTFNSGESNDATLAGFTITGGSGSTDTTIDWRTVFQDTNGEGGAIFCRSASPTITHNIIRDNTCRYGGGAIYCHDHASPIIAHNTIRDNYAGWYGGAVFGRVHCSPQIYQNKIINNSCQYLGGAIYLADRSSPDIYQNWFEKNKAKNGGAFYYFYNSSPAIVSNLMVENIADQGSAVFVSCPDGKIINNTIVNNKVVSHFADSAALHIRHNTDIANNLIANHTHHGIYTETDAGSSILKNNNLWNNSQNFYGHIPDQTGINGNISADPCVIGKLPAPLTSYELSPGSPCIDAGDTASVPVWLTADLDNSARQLDAHVDIGAQEYFFTAVPQDYPTIQGAIDAAATGDTILVSPGFYQENISFKGKNLVLRSLNPLDPCTVRATIIDGNQTTSCIQLISGEDKSAVVAGFNIQNGNAVIPGLDYGGGIYIADYCGATVLYNYFHHNYAGKYGGGLDTRHYSDTVVKHNTFVHNSCGHMGAGVHVGHHAKCLIYDNHIAHNNAKYQGGGIYVFNYSDVDILNNYIHHNTTQIGGGIYTWWARGDIAYNHIWSNVSTFRGGGIALHPSYSVPEQTISNIYNNIIEGNITDDVGGGIYLIQGITNIHNNTVIGNVSTTHKGAGIALESGADADIVNNIAAFNLGGSGLYLGPTSDPNNFHIPDVLANNIFQNEAGNYNGEISDLTGQFGNISSDPCFLRNGLWDDNNTPADPADDFWIPGDYRLPWFSPARDAGIDAALTPDNDFFKKPRPAFAAVDMGAVECQFYDLSATGTVDFTDLDLILDNWLFYGNNIPVDLNKDDHVDLLDIHLLTQDWLK